MLALATTGEPGANPRQSAVDLSQLGANEIFNAVHHVLDARSRMPDMAGEDAKPSALEQTLAEYEPDLDTAFLKLTDYIDPDKIREAFTLLTGSGSPLDRRFAGAYIGSLTRVDHDYGLKLWEQLLQDDEHYVASSTWELSTARYLEHEPEELRAKLAEDGITWKDFQDLAWTYVRRLENFRNDNTYPDGLAF